MNWKDKKVVVIGAARQGLALSHYLAEHGAQVTLTDSKPESAIGANLDTVKASGVQLCLGSHPSELLDDLDLLCLSGGVPLSIPLVQQALARGIPLSNDSQIFMEACPSTVIGITGSAGKTTTTALVGSIAHKFFEMKQSPNRAWIGGNIGNPLIEQVDEMQADDLVVLELSSFQLELMTRSPQIAAILNITPNHLDRHGTMQAYTVAKANILRYQSNADVAILNREDEGAWALQDQMKSALISFGLRKPVGATNGTYVDHRGHVCLQIGKDNIRMFPTEWIQLRGKHNLLNVLAACAIAAGASLALPAIQTAVEEFSAVPHRLQFIRRVRGADWYNDSIATAPERSIAAIDSFQERLVLLLGGRDKDLPWAKLAKLVHQRVAHVILFGEAADLIAAALGETTPGETLLSIDKCATLQEAVIKASELVQEDDVVLLSPGGTSYDAFIDFEERGEAFTQWVNELT